MNNHQEATAKHEATDEDSNPQHNRQREGTENKLPYPSTSIEHTHIPE
jgi:hypothetical protein